MMVKVIGLTQLGLTKLNIVKLKDNWQKVMDYEIKYGNNEVP